MKRADIVKTLILTVSLTVFVLLGTWVLGGFEGLSGHGVAALIAGVLVAIAVGVGLMTVVFISAREHDEAAHSATRRSPMQDDTKDR